MAKVNSKAVIGRANNTEVSPVDQKAKQTVGGLLQAMLDSENYRNRFQELLGARMPQFMGSVVSMVSEDPYLKEAFFNAPMTVIQSALKAASYNLPIDKALGFAYVVPFWNSKTGKREAQFILGYRGMIQLANRTGAYERLNVVDVRQGELKKFDRLTEDVDVEWIADEAEREKLPVVGYLGYFRLVNGYEKKIYMSVSQIDAHEKKFRKGKAGTKRPAIWEENYDGMACKTVLRRLIGKWGLMSIDYQKADTATIKIAQDIATGTVDDELTIDAPVEEAPAAIPEKTATAQKPVAVQAVAAEPEAVGIFGPEVPKDELVDF